MSVVRSGYTDIQGPPPPPPPPSLPTSALEWQGTQTVKLKSIINWNKQSQGKGKIILFKMQIYPTDMYSHHLTSHPRQKKSKNKREHLFLYNEIITILLKGH